MSSYVYHQAILDELARHGLCPLPGTTPLQLRNAVRDLYTYEIRRLKQRLLAGRLERGNYARAVVELRTRYRVLSIPTELWTIP